MNIFYLNNNPTICAEMYCDKHVVKMILETAQILCTVHHLCGNADVPYKPSHVKHPCTLWALKNTNNYLWLCDLGKAIAKEYTYRYGKRHKSEDVIDLCEELIPNLLPAGNFIEPPKCMPDEYKCNDTIQSYINYYKFKLDNPNMFKYTNRKIPDIFER